MWVYHLLVTLLFCLSAPVLVLVWLFSAKRRKTLGPRLGISNLPRPRGTTHASRQPIWVHALSVGEVLSAEPVIAALKDRQPETPLVLSVTTYTGWQMARQRLASRVDQLCFMPLDLPWAVRRVAGRIDPKVVILVETDIWPGFIHYVSGRHIPLFWINARLSARTFDGYHRLRWLMRPLLERFSLILAQTPADTLRFAQLGISPERLMTTGNVKFDRLYPVPSEEDLAALRHCLGLTAERPVILAGSTHEGEETIFWAAYRALRPIFPNLAAIVAPRDPARAPVLLRDCQKAQIAAQTLTQRERAPQALFPQVLIVDQIGRLQALYGLCQAAFIGGSLVPCGGHNPLEAAALAKPVAFGPHMTDFKMIADDLIDAQAAVRVDDPAALTQFFTQMLKDPAQARCMGAAGQRLCAAHQGAVRESLDAIEGCLSQKERSL